MIRLHHVGIVVHALKSAVSRYCRAIGVNEETIIFQRGQYATERGEVEEFEYAFIPAGGGTFIELVMPVSEGPTMRYLRKRGEGLFHLAFEADDVESAVKQFQDAGIPLAGRTPTGKLLSVFFHPKHANGVLLQLVKKGLFLQDGSVNPEALK
nr:hypothetical protein [Candidatus Bathyarchaeota archaeon]